MTDLLSAKPCCTPPRAAPPLTKGEIAVDPAAARVLKDAAAPVPGGRGLLGTHDAQIADDGESPLRTTRISPFRMGRNSVTNAEFADFVAATDYITEAERFGWSFVFWAQVPRSVGPTQGIVGTEWWRRVDRANWRDINGPDTMDAAWHPDHPVVQVSWNDAQAYAKWAGGRLPTEAEWEHAARGGLRDVRFPWGNAEPNETDHTPCNIWQGRFPETNTAADGYLTTAPAGSFSANGYGLFNMVGNVWEWTADPFRIASLKKQVKERLAGMKGYKLSKGGSFLCHASYCYRYRIAARSGTSPDSATPHQGFRVIWPQER
ncbi:formylglycine-generating enzyme family protein [Jannaschia sp. M317]|uniref:formylglycine-generating enzyme family protein n=1 Tax=Jannaschia sp. M317 TaxID=2867011 RepID=UPI0021A9147C|nr:formylglycine-generating enzyme family protein [Jannaschia sp. M317]UWQ17770.1 formylglycine-generating enzyme family protein [Jannaschia sp. M317]